MSVTKGWAKVAVWAAFGAAWLLGTLLYAPAAQAKGGDGTIIQLRGSAQYPNANGKAKYKAEGGEREFEVELEDARALKGKVLTVYANGAKVGTFRVNNLGNGRLERNSDLGQNVPNIHAGSPVQIKTAAGVLVVSCSF